MCHLSHANKIIWQKTDSYITARCNLTDLFLSFNEQFSNIGSKFFINLCFYSRDKLAPVKLNRYKDDVLFYMFYTNVGDVLQLAAAAEL